MGDDPRIVQFSDDLIRNISRTLAGATGEQNHIGGLQRALQALPKQPDVVMSNAQPQRFAAKLADCVREHLAIGVVNMGRPHRLAGRDDLIASREDSDDGFAPDADVRDADGCEHAGVAAGQQLAAAKHGFPGRDIRARERDPAACVDRPRDQKFFVADLNVFDHDDRVRATGHHAAGRDQGGLARVNGRTRDDAGVDLLLNQEDCARRFFGGTKRVLRNDGEAVDVRTIERRNVDGRDHIVRQHPTKRRVERNELPASRSAVDNGTEAPLGLVAIDDLEKLLLVTHTARLSLRLQRRNLRCRR